MYTEHTAHISANMRVYVCWAVYGKKNTLKLEKCWKFLKVIAKPKVMKNFKRS